MVTRSLLVIYFIYSWKVRVTQSCLTLCDPVDYTVHGILQPRILEWVAFPFSRGSSHPRTEPRSPTLQADSLPAELPGTPILNIVSCYIQYIGPCDLSILYIVVRIC